MIQGLGIVIQDAVSGLLANPRLRLQQRDGVEFGRRIDVPIVRLNDQAMVIRILE